MLGIARLVRGALAGPPGGHDADNAVKRGAEAVAKVVGGVVTGAVGGAVGGVVLAGVLFHMSGATYLDPTTCGAALVAGFAAGGAVVGAVLGAETALREIESTRPATGMSLPATCSEHRPWRQ